MRIVAAFAIVILCGAGASPIARAQQPEAMSLLGKLLVPPAPSNDEREALEAELKSARAAAAKSPGDATATLAAGRALAALGRYHEALEILTTGIEAHGDDPRLYRARGGHYITIRKFDVAIRDLSKAAELTSGKPDPPDGGGSLAANTHFLLGAAYYLKWDFAHAREAFKHAAHAATSDEDRQKIAHWLYMTLRRLNQPDEAARIVEPFAIDALPAKDEPYARLIALYRGRMKADDVVGGKGADAVTLAYGAAAWYLYSDNLDEAKKRLRHIVDKDEKHWPQLDYIAAEADYARVVKIKKKKR